MDIKLPDEEFDQTGDIDLLLRADLFYEMLRSDRRKIPGIYPVVQGRVLGWTLSGQSPTITTQLDTKPTFLVRENNNL